MTPEIGLVTGYGTVLAWGDWTDEPEIFSVFILIPEEHRAVANALYMLAFWEEVVTSTDGFRITSPSYFDHIVNAATSFSYDYGIEPGHATHKITLF